MKTRFKRKLFVVLEGSLRFSQMKLPLKVAFFRKPKHVLQYGK